MLALPPELRRPFGSDPALRYWSPVAGVEPDALATAIAEDLCSGTRVALLAGNAAVQHPQAARTKAAPRARSRSL